MDQVDITVTVPKDIVNEANDAVFNLLPAKSKDRYLKMTKFRLWMELKKKIQIILLIFLVLWTYTASAESNYCCQDKGPFINRTCSGGEESWTKKNCQNGAYVILEYTMLDYDVLNFKNNLIEKERYCLGSFENETDIVAIICFKKSVEDSPVSPIAVNICCGISITCLLLTTIVYILLPKLRDLQGKCIMITVINLLFSYVALFILQKANYITYTPCLILAASMYFLFLSAFFWINVVAINIWRTTVRPKFLPNSKYIFTFYNIYGWGIPIILLTTALICHHVPGNHIKPGWSEYSCWFADTYPQIIYFHIPILIVMSMNIVMFISVGWKIWRYERNNSTNEQSTNIRIHKSRKYKCILYLKLFLIMGITWIFEPMSMIFYNGGYYIWLLTDYVNALQGVIIFLVLVVFRKRVRRDLARRGGIICGRLPKDWALIADEEMEELEDEMDEEEQVTEYNVQLNQPF